MTRRCSHCSANGHNARTCPSRADHRSGACVKLFGVRIADGSAMKKSASVGCLSHYSSSSLSSSPTALEELSGYASDDPIHASCSSNCRGERKKGTPWTEEEHRMFLVGLQKLGKGDWRGISRKYVMSRTPTQVASHAQKYFIRQTNASRRKRRSSLFDMVNDTPDNQMALPEESSSPSSLHSEQEPANNKPLLDLNQDQESLAVQAGEETPMVDTTDNTSCTGFTSMVPAFYPAYVPIPVPFWTPIATVPEEEPVVRQAHEVLRPTPVVPKEPVHLDELIVMSRLSLADHRMEPSALSSELHGVASSTRRSAFHASQGMNQTSGSNAVVHAV